MISACSDVIGRSIRLRWYSPLVGAEYRQYLGDLAADEHDGILSRQAASDVIEVASSDNIRSAGVIVAAFCDVFR